MVSAVAPNAFENRIRICFPPMETCTICRSVLSVKPGAGGSFLASPSCGEEAHVPTQWSSLSFAPDLLCHADAGTTAIPRNKEATKISSLLKKPPFTDKLHPSLAELVKSDKWIYQLIAFSHALTDHHLSQECSVPSGRKVRVVGVLGIALRLLQCNEFEASLLEQFEKSRQHDSFKHTDVQEHHMLDVALIDLVRYFLSDGKGFGRSTQIALLQPVNRLHIVLRKAPRIRLVVGIVAKVERHLGHLVSAHPQDSEWRTSSLGRTGAFIVGLVQASEDLNVSI